METRSFQADAQQILRLVTHSIYSDREIFLRELLSNASDALDKARFLGVKNDDNRKVEGEAGIRVTLNSEDNTLVIEDDGVGMSEAEIVENLGTIAQSGTKKFLEKIEQEGELDSLIGQFGVGFYSAFMVADRVTVESLSIKPAEKAVKWESEGGESYSIGECEKASRGTKITLHLSETGQEFCDEAKLRGIIQNHSDFIQWPINLGEERINQETALWL
jgi:molecular chaperone HtpG